MTHHPLRTATPSAIPERPGFVHGQRRNSPPPLTLLLDDVQVDRIAIMRHRHAKSRTHPGLASCQNHPSGSCAPLSTSPAPSWTPDNRAQAELPAHRWPGHHQRVAGPRVAWVRERAGVGGSGVTGGAAERVVVQSTPTGGN